MTSQEKSTAKMKTRFLRWRAKLDALSMKAAESRNDTLADDFKGLSKLRRTFENAQKKPTEFKSAGDGKCDTLKSDAMDQKMLFREFMQNRILTLQSGRQWLTL